MSVVRNLCDKLLPGFGYSFCRKAVFVLVQLFLMNGFLVYGSEQLLKVDFDGDKIGPYTKAMLDKDWRTPRWSRGVKDGRLSVVASGGRGNVLRVQYPAEVVGMRGGGAGWRTVIGTNELVYMSYKLRFRPGFKFVRGGKLPGLGGGKCNTGGHPPTGKDGCSVRFMWLKHGGLSVYVYHPDQPGKYGEHFKATRLLTTGEWHELKMRVKLNTPGKHDGSVVGWLDGEQVIDVKKLRFRDVDTIKLNKVLFETFFGGGTPSYRALRDEFIEFDDFRVWADVN